MKWRVDWNRGQYDVRGPRLSFFWTYEGRVSAATPALSRLVGRKTAHAIESLYRSGFTVKQVAHEAVPPTLKYHKQLLANVTALLTLLEKPMPKNGMPPVHPGEVIREEYFGHGRRPREVAAACGLPLEIIIEISEERRDVTVHLATKLATGLGASAGFWLNLQQAHDVAKYGQ